ncbi:exonuclease domain-containing protein [Streptomyces jumonjinensis]|uniref:exonuclease domain-containing protein n=1 Tax=Streptomyces jumonjinensis TaxID=1945 RepID=UPI00379964B1
MSTTATVAGAAEIPSSRAETDPDRVPRGESRGEHEGAPVYGWGSAPQYLRTQTQLGEDRLRLADGQAPLAYLWLRKHGYVPLYDPGAAVKMRPLASSTKRAMAERRTCPQCRTVRPYRVRGTCCSECWKKEQRRQQRDYLRTCGGCGTVRERPYPEHRRCQGCRTEQLDRKRARVAAWLTEVVLCSADGCSVKLGTKKGAMAWLKDTPWMLKPENQGPDLSWRPDWPRRCAPCTAEHERRQAEILARYEREAAERRAAEETAAREAAEKRRRWAADALADPDVVVLDTETTGLHAEARIVEIAVLSSSGAVLLDSLVDPGEPVPRASSRIHGITDDMIRSAAAPTFSDLLVRLTGVLDRKRVLIYNASFDRARLRYELTVHYQRAASAAGEAPETAAASAAAWLDTMTFEDVMHPYSAWCGDWSEYHGDYTWQPLNGGHRAAGDCRAVLRRLAVMGRDGQGQAEEEEFETAAAGGGWGREAD